jgi:hypothetical protein
MESVEAEPGSLVETAACGGAVPKVLEALQDRETERRRLLHEITIRRRRPGGALELPSRYQLRNELPGRLTDWQNLLSKNVAGARELLRLVLADRIAFRPIVNDDAPAYELTGPVAWDNALRAHVPVWKGLQDEVASPTGMFPSCRFPGEFVQADRLAGAIRSGR